MCIAMYIMRTYASGHGASKRARGAGGWREGEEREKDRNETGVGREERRRGGRRESKRESEGRETRRKVTIRERKMTIKEGKGKGGRHADEGGGEGERGKGGERGKEGTRESIEVYEKTIELICKQ